MKLNTNLMILGVLSTLAADAITLDDAKAKIKATAKNVVDFDYSLTGPWRSGCVDIAAFGIDRLSLASMIKEVEFYPNGSHYGTETYFLKSGCAEPAMEFKTVAVIEKLTHPDKNSPRYNVDLRPTEQFITVRSPELAKVMNQTHYCESAWAHDHEVDVTNKSCSALKPGQIIQEAYEIGKDHHLRLGRASEFTARFAPDRPGALNQQFVYQRK